MAVQSTKEHAIAMKPTNIDHIVLRAIDPEGLMRFYIDVIGCTHERTQTAIGLIQLRAGSSLIDIVTAPTIDCSTTSRDLARNMDHFCLVVDATEDELIAELDAKAIDHSEAASRYGASGLGRSVYLHDPEGNEIELRPERVKPGD